VTARVAVVGAGIIGCAVAREIVDRAPDTDVVVLDRDIVGSGASRRSAGLHFPRGASERVRAMSAYSEDWYRRLAEREPDVPIHALPMTVIAGADRADEVRAAYQPSAKLTTTDQHTHDLVRVPDGALAWTGEGCQYADVAGLAAHLARGLRDRVSFREGTAVTGVADAPGGVRLTHGTGETLDVDRVVLAPGPWVGAPAWGEALAPQGVRVK
jgi:glycine/D-amino acid oxidase-like deaminating enzyme